MLVDVKMSASLRLYIFNFAVISRYWKNSAGLFFNATFSKEQKILMNKICHLEKNFRAKTGQNAASTRF